MKSKIVGLVAATLMCVSGMSAAFGQAKEERYGDWFYECREDGNCLITQGIVQEDSGARLGLMSLLNNDQGGTDMVLSGPLGILLPPGFTVIIDDKQDQTMQLPILLCDNSGCQTRQTVSADVIAALQQGKQLKLLFSGIDNKQFNIVFSLLGFSKAYSKLTEGG